MYINEPNLVYGSEERGKYLAVVNSAANTNIQTVEEYERILNPRKRRLGNKQVLRDISIEQEKSIKLLEKKLQRFVFGSQNEAFSNYNFSDFKEDIEFYTSFQEADTKCEKELDHRVLYL